MSRIETEEFLGPPHVPLAVMQETDLDREAAAYEAVSHGNPRQQFRRIIALSNTTPRRYLNAIEQEYLLKKLFEKVFVPAAVHEEWTEARPPENVRRRVLSLPF